MFTAEEAALFEAEASAALASVDAKVAGRAEAEHEEIAESIGNYNDFWFNGDGGVVETRRTSLVIDPPDGRIPPMTPEAQEKRAQLRAVRKGTNRHEPTPGGWVEDLGPGMFAVRCMVGFNSGPPMTPGAYNQNVQVFQNEDTVVLLNEMVHSARIVSLDGRKPLDSKIRQYMGDTRGYWDGDTLVVETTNVLLETSFQGGLSDENLHLIARLTRLSPTTLLYQVTVEDPTVWTAPWIYKIPMKKSEFPIYEYACHEGNYGLPNILAATRDR